MTYAYLLFTVSPTIVYLQSRDPDKVITPLGGSYVVENVQCCILQVQWLSDTILGPRLFCQGEREAKHGYEDRVWGLDRKGGRRLRWPGAEKREQERKLCSETLVCTSSQLSSHIAHVALCSWMTATV